MSTTVHDVIRQGFRFGAAWVGTTCAALGLDPDTPFDPDRQRCVVVTVCTTCGGSGSTRRLPGGVLLVHSHVCPDCSGRGWVA